MGIVLKSEIVLVTGANGYIGSATVRVLVDHGYLVRGAVRSAKKNQWMKAHFGPNFQLIEVPDMNVPNAYSEAVKGVSGIVHIAANTQMADDKAVIDQTVASTIGLLETASKEISIKRVVMTSSQAAAVSPQPGKPYRISKNTYNDYAVDLVTTNHTSEAASLNPMAQGSLIYAAAKTLSDKKAFEWVREHKPTFIYNCVVPNLNLGGVESVKDLGLPSSSSVIDGLSRGNPFGALIMNSQWYVNVTDTGLLHLAALTIEEVQSERILAFSSSFSWTQILEILRRRYPDRAFADVEEPIVDDGTVDNSYSIELLKKLGKDGFKTLEETVVENMDAVIHGELLPDKPKSRLDVVMEAMQLQPE